MKISVVFFLVASVVVLSLCLSVDGLEKFSRGTFSQKLIIKNKAGYHNDDNLGDICHNKMQSLESDDGCEIYGGYKKEGVKNNNGSVISDKECKKCKKCKECKKCKKCKESKKCQKCKLCQNSKDCQNLKDCKGFTNYQDEKDYKDGNDCQNLKGNDDDEYDDHDDDDDCDDACDDDCDDDCDDCDDGCDDDDDLDGKRETMSDN